MLENHHFNVEIAKLLGIHAAVILDQFLYWIKRNHANNDCIHNNRVWCSASNSALQEIFPYFTKDKIEYGIKKLKNNNIILVDFFSKNSFNRTRFFSLTDEFIKCLENKDFSAFRKIPKSISENSEMEIGKLQNQISENSEMEIGKLQNQISENSEMLCTTVYPTVTSPTVFSDKHISSDEEICTHGEKSPCVSSVSSAIVPDEILPSENQEQAFVNRQMENHSLITKHKQAQDEVIESDNFALQPVEQKAQQPKSDVLDKQATLRASTWQHYEQAYIERYSIRPLRNKKVNSQVKAFVELVGEDAPKIAYFYVFHNNAWYIRKGHDIGTLLSDAQAIARDFYRGQQTTAKDAQQIEKQQSSVSQRQRLSEYFDNKEKQEQEQQNAA